MGKNVQTLKKVRRERKKKSRKTLREGLVSKAKLFSERRDALVFRV